jgi:hypothetical protein
MTFSLCLAGPGQHHRLGPALFPLAVFVVYFPPESWPQNVFGRLKRRTSPRRELSP